MVITVIGGISSGKSKYAEEKAISLGEKRLYIATSEVTDDDMLWKIQKHIKRRENKFVTAENYDKIDELIVKSDADVIMIDCVTNMINNVMYHSKIDFDVCNNDVFDEFVCELKAYVDRIIKAMNKSTSNIVIVSSELGLSVIAMNIYTRRFVMLQGEINQMLASNSDEVYFVMSGIASKIK